MPNKVKKILIAGDSFASNALAKNKGWPYLLSRDFDVTNIAQPGIGQYKILQSLRKINIKKFDAIIVSHTSPNRLNVEFNPLYPIGHVYRNSDLIYSDAKEKQNHSQHADKICYYFENLFDIDFYHYVHSKCCEDIEKLLDNKPTLHITHFDWKNFYEFKNLINFYKLWQKNKGEFNHYNEQTNKILYNELKKLIDCIK